MKHGGDIYTNGTLVGRKILDFSSNVNPLPISESFKSHIDEAYGALPLYPDIKYRTLKNNLIRYIEKSSEYFKNTTNHFTKDIKYSLDLEDIIVGNGASEVLDMVIGTLNSITIVVPSFVEYEDLSKKHNLHINHSFLNEEMEYDYEDILNNLNKSEGLILANPNNPNGGIINHEKFIKVLDYCEEHDKLVIIDEAFIEFVLDNDKTFVNYVDNYNCLVIVRAITKFFSMAGVRLGYGITKNVKVKKHICNFQNPWTVNCFAELAAKYALFDEDFIEKSIQWLLEERNFMYGALTNVSYIDKAYRSHGNYFLCKLKGIKSHELMKLLMEKGILIRNCDNYEGLNDSYVRIALKDRKKNLKILEALNEIK